MAETTKPIRVVSTSSDEEGSVEVDVETAMETESDDPLAQSQDSPASGADATGDSVEADTEAELQSSEAAETGLPSLHPSEAPPLRANTGREAVGIEAWANGELGRLVDALTTVGDDKPLARLAEKVNGPPPKAEHPKSAVDVAYILDQCRCLNAADPQYGPTREEGRAAQVKKDKKPAEKRAPPRRLAREHWPGADNLDAWKEAATEILSAMGSTVDRSRFLQDTLSNLADEAARRSAKDPKARLAGRARPIGVNFAQIWRHIGLLGKGGQPPTLQPLEAATLAEAVAWAEQKAGAMPLGGGEAFLTSLAETLAMGTLSFAADEDRSLNPLDLPADLTNPSLDPDETSVGKEETLDVVA